LGIDAGKPQRDLDLVHILHISVITPSNWRIPPGRDADPAPFDARTAQRREPSDFFDFAKKQSARLSTRRSMN
jgi:hypothetical protein